VRNTHQDAPSVSAPQEDYKSSDNRKGTTRGKKGRLEGNSKKGEKGHHSMPKILQEQTGEKKGEKNKKDGTAKRVGRDSSQEKENSADRRPGQRRKGGKKTSGKKKSRQYPAKGQPKKRAAKTEEEKKRSPVADRDWVTGRRRDVGWFN